MNFAFYLPVWAVILLVIAASLILTAAIFGIAMAIAFKDGISWK